MNTVQKAVFAASALAITLVGAVLVTAPILFARPRPVVVLACLSRWDLGPRNREAGPTGQFDHRLARTPAISVTS
jgi:hypothetical protein